MTHVLAVGELVGGKKMDRWGFLKKLKWDYYQKNVTNTTMHQNQRSAAEVVGLDKKICVNMGGKTSGGGFGGTTRSNGAFGFGGGSISGVGFGNTNQYQDYGNETGN